MSPAAASITLLRSSLVRTKAVTSATLSKNKVASSLSSQKTNVHNVSKKSNSNGNGQLQQLPSSSSSSSSHYMTLSNNPKNMTMTPTAITMTNITTTTATRSFSTKIQRDKYGRLIIQRKVVRNPNRTTLKKKKKTSSKWPSLQKILTPTNVTPKPPKPLPPTVSSSISTSLSLSSSSSAAVSSSSSAAAAGTNSITNGSRTNTKKIRKKFLKWLQENAGILILNIGSIATLTAFTRNDMLELRMLSMVGSTSTIIYFLSRPPPFMKGPIIWSSIFLCTNAVMAYYILEEREGKTRQFTAEEENVYEEHFLPYGVTPRQYEKLLNIAEKVKLPRGKILIQQAELFDSVYLVTSGSTDGMTNMSRRVTAASSTKGNRNALAGGDAGAWIGELAFMGYLEHGREKQNLSKKDPSSSDGGSGSGSGVVDVASTLATAASNSVARTLATAAAKPKSNEDANKSNDHENASLPNNGSDKNTVQRTNSQTNHAPNMYNDKAILTYIANQDSVLYKWDFKALAVLLNSSTELRLSVTRAMTAAVMNKVVNLYISKNDVNLPMWKRWMEGMNEKNNQLQNEVKSASRRPTGEVRFNVVQKDS